MQYLKKRQTDPQYLKTVIDQKQIIIEEQQRKYTLLLKQHELNLRKISELQSLVKTQQNASQNQTLNLNMAIRQLEAELQAMKHDKSEFQFKINMMNLKLKEQEKQHTNKIQSLKIDYEGQKQNLNLKIQKLEKNLSALATHYNVTSQINSDKLKLIEDANRDLRGFSNEKQQRMIMIQNQQYANEIEFQAKEIQGLLQKNEKLQEELKNMRSQLELHKEIENDLVKRSSLAQKLIKQLNKRIRELQDAKMIESSRAKIVQSNVRSVNHSEQSSRLSSSKMTSSQPTKELQQELAKLRFQYANLKNHSLYLENMQKVHSQKYETLGHIMAEYLENLSFFGKRKDNQSRESELQSLNEVNIDVAQLKKKDVKQWRTQQLETVLFLLLTQIKPFLSKSSLTSFPELKNINVSFTEAEQKQPISLPKIAQTYQKTYQKQSSKINGRFKDIPLDISTKILRSNLRQWGTKVNYGSNIPSLARVKKLKSRSIAESVDRSGFL